MAQKVAISFYRDWWDMLNEPAVTPEEQLAILRTILAYAFDGVKPDASDRTMFFATFGALKRIDRDNDKRDAEITRVLRSRAKQSVTERNTAKQSITERNTAEQSVTERNTAEQSVTERNTAEQSVTERNTAEQAPNNYIINNDIINSLKEKEKEKEKITIGESPNVSTPPKSPPKKRTRFLPPTLAEVQSYCAANSIIMDAAAFHDHFTSNGWKVSGRAAMKDWKAAARNWARRESQFTKRHTINSDDDFNRRIAVGLATMPG